ncbi:MAG: hypothetical protein ACRDJX_00085 [Solirubrobacteraceae bacterium]
MTPEPEIDAGTPASPRGAPDARPERPAPAPLQPLGESERPPALFVAIGVCVVLAGAVLIGGLTVHNLSRHGGSLPGAIFIAAIFVGLAAGMYRRRYMAVLGFEALLTFQIIATSLALLIATSILAAVLCLVAIMLGGWLFWKLIRIMGRIQAGERAGLPPLG